MFRLVAVAMAVVFAIAGWRNLPPMTDQVSSAAGFTLAACVLIAYWMGRRSTRAHAVAQATASARAEAAAAAHAGAQSLAQVVVVTGDGHGAREAAQRAFGQPSWVGARQVGHEQLEGSDAYQSIADELADYQEQQE